MTALGDVLAAVSARGRGLGVIAAVAAALLASGCAGHSGGGATAAGGQAGTAVATATASATSAATATPTPDAGGTPAATGSGHAPHAPDAVVTAFFSAVNRHDWQRAWQLGGKNLSPSYNAFVQGFAGTARDDVTITATRGGTVLVLLAAIQADGHARTYHGTYQVSNGAISRGQETLHSNGSRGPAVFSAFAGPWSGHDRSLSISARGLGIASFRVFSFCSPHRLIRPCDSVSGNTIYPGGVTVFQLTGRSGDRAHGSIQDSSTALSASGPITVVFHRATGTITLSQPGQEATDVYCGPHSPPGYCGA
ncbi:MAG: hypothetical protein LBI49_24555 [Nocardiopsaceae bacterium]|jgi:hypothetical protein|nr:hypothetical protein [Nocardiopsaceae bacterium]